MMKKMISLFLIFFLLIPVLVISVIPVVHAGGLLNLEDDQESWLKGILFIMLSFFLNKYSNPGENQNNQQPQIDDKPLIEDDNIELEGEVMGFYVNWLTQYADSYKSLSRNYNSLDMVAPFWYTVNPDGEIESRYGGHQYEVTSLAREKGLNVLPLINNNQQNNMVLVNPEIREKAVTNIVNLVKTNGYQGVNIDFEFLPSWTRSGYTAFIKSLSRELKKENKILTIDVFPKYDVPLNLQGAYDYSALAPHVDRMVIMTYDHHWSTGPAGPIAPIDWVEHNIKYALEYVPADKILLGIANYGYDWSADGLASDIGTNQAQIIAREKSAEIQWDDNAKSPYYNYWDKAGNKHQVWYENSYSLKYKLNLVKKYNLKGIAIWRLGNETPRFWETINNSL